MNIEVDLTSRRETNTEDLTQSFEKPTFTSKENISWNGYIQNIYRSTGNGVLMTSGLGLSYDQAANGALIHYNGKDYSLPFSWLATKDLHINNVVSGELKSSTYWNNQIYAIYESNDETVEVIMDEDLNVLSKTVLNATSAVYSSVYNLDRAPLRITVYTNEDEPQVWSNHIEVQELDGAVIDTYDSTDFIPLGEANSATVRTLKNKQIIVAGFVDIDNNRTRSYIWTEGNAKPKEYHWFGTVSARGDITGEPIPDLPDNYPQRNSNGTYSWDVSNDKEYNIIGGYYINEVTQAYEPITIWSYVKDRQARVNISVNDTKLNDDDIDPMMYFVSNFADSKGVYYDFGPGWMRTYLRVTDDTSSSSLKVYTMEIFTFGCKTTSLQNTDTLAGRTHIDSLMARGNTSEWPVTATKLNQRVYTVGGNNKATSSILGTLPFTVEVLPSTYDNYENIRSLDMQIYALLPLSWSFNKTLLTTAGEDNRAAFTVIKNGDHIVLCENQDVIVIDKTTDTDYLKITKVADYNYKTNILDRNNLIQEDRYGNIEIQRSFIPYNMDCVLNIDGLNLLPPGVSEVDSNNTWYWAAAVNPQLIDTSSSYLYSVIALPIFIDSTQLTDFQNEAIEQRGSILKANLKGLFDNYETVDIFYTISTYSTTIEYKTTQVVKNNDTNSEYAVFGKDTYDVEQAGTYYIFTSYSLFPLGICSVVEGVNYIIPTVLLNGQYSARLVQSSNLLKLCYSYDSKVFMGNEIFTIYGGNYYYDGQAIYYTGSSTNLNDSSSSNQFTCYALGLSYIAASGAESFFYSDWEKRLFIFNASGTMQPADSLSSVGKVIDGLWSSKEQMLYLLTDSNELIMCSSTDTAVIENIPDNVTLIGTEKGAGLLYDKKYLIYSPREDNGYDQLPIALETSYLGLDGHILKCQSVDMLLYKVNEEADVTFYFKALNGDKEVKESVKYDLHKADWKGNIYRLRITPKNAIAQAFKCGIESNDHIAVAYIGFNIEDIDKMPAANANGPRRIR